MSPSDDFVLYAIKVFEVYHWKPARPDTLSAPHLIVWGNLTSSGEGAHCVIDTKAKLFKLEVKLSSPEIKLATKVILHYSDNKEAVARFDYYMNLIGKFIEDSGSFVDVY